jgi:hypothetical protein
MQVLLTSMDYTYMEHYATKVKVRLQTGEAEFYEQHQELLGVIISDFVQIERTIDNKVEIRSFMVQDSVVVVTTPKKEDLNPESPNPNNITYVFIYCKQAIEIDSQTPIDKILTNCENLKIKLLKEQENLSFEKKENPKDVGVAVLETKILMLQRDISYYEKVLKKVKEFKK